MATDKNDKRSMVFQDYLREQGLVEMIDRGMRLAMPNVDPEELITTLEVTLLPEEKPGDKPTKFTFKCVLEGRGTVHDSKLTHPIAPPVEKKPEEPKQGRGPLPTPPRDPAVWRTGSRPPFPEDPRDED